MEEAGLQVSGGRKPHNRPVGLVGTWPVPKVPRDEPPGLPQEPRHVLLHTSAHP